LDELSKMLDNEVKRIQPISTNYEKFLKTVQKIARKTIPRGCRQNYIAGLRQDLINDLKEYEKEYEK
jgi:hypothetical protein